MNPDQNSPDPDVVINPGTTDIATTDATTVIPEPEFTVPEPSFTPAPAPEVEAESVEAPAEAPEAPTPQVETPSEPAIEAPIEEAVEQSQPVTEATVTVEEAPAEEPAVTPEEPSHEPIETEVVPVEQSEPATPVEAPAEEVPAAEPEPIADPNVPIATPTVVTTPGEQSAPAFSAALDTHEHPKKSLKLGIIAGIVVLVIAAAVPLLAVSNHMLSKKVKSSDISKAAGSIVGATGGQNVATQQYTDSQGRFKLALPTNWQTLTPQTGDLADFQASDAASDGSRPYVNVVSANTSGASLNQLVANVQTALAQQTKDFKALNSQQEVVSGLPAVMLTYSITLSDHSITNTQLFVIKGSTAYSLTGVTSSGTWTQNKDVIEKTLLSFQL